jgi:hypothetical protein
VNYIKKSKKLRREGQLLFLFRYGHRLQLTTPIVVFITLSNELLGHFNDRKTKEEGGEVASSQSVCLPAVLFLSRK